MEGDYRGTLGWGLLAYTGIVRAQALWKHCICKRTLKLGPRIISD